MKEREKKREREKEREREGVSEWKEIERKKKAGKLRILNNEKHFTLYHLFFSSL